MIEAELRAKGKQSVRPPSDTDRVFRVFGSETGAAADDVVVKFIPHREEGGRSDPKHRVAQNSPLRRIAGLHWKRTTLKWDLSCRMRLRTVHVHVKRLGRSVDLVVKLVRPGSNY